MIYFVGSSALSESAQHALLDKLSGMSHHVTHIAARFGYFVGLRETLTTEQCQTLVSLLHDDTETLEEIDVQHGRTMVVAPHFTQETQWSRDVTRIAHDCGLYHVTRVEQIVIYWITASKPLNDSINQRLNDILCESETMSIFPDVDFAKLLFEENLSTSGAQSPSIDAASLAPQQDLWLTEWVINGEPQHKTLQNILNSYYDHHRHDLLWHQDSWAIIAGAEAPYWYVNQNHIYQQRQTDVHHCVHIDQFNWQATYQPFSAFCVARGHRLHSVYSGYVTPDLLIPNFVQTWENCATESQPDTLAQLVMTIQRRSDYWLQLGLPLLGGFLRTLPVTEPHTISVYSGFAQPDGIPTPSTHETTVLYRIHTTSPRAVARVFSQCVDLDNDNPIASAFAQHSFVYCRVLKPHQYLFESIVRNTGCQFSLVTDHETAQLNAQPPENVQLRVRELAKPNHNAFALADTDINEMTDRILALPAVAAKSCIIHHTDQSSGGLVVQAAMVSAWQLPISNLTIMANSFTGKTGIVKSCGEKINLANINPLAMVRMAVGEAITNMMAAHLPLKTTISLALGWHLGGKPADAALYEAMQYLTDTFIPALGMQIVVNDIHYDNATSSDTDRPLELTVFAHANTHRVRHYYSPYLKPCDGASVLILIDLGHGLNRMGGSALSQVMACPHTSTPDIAANTLIRFRKVMNLIQTENWIVAYHDRSDGGLFVTLCEMAFSGRLGLRVYLDALGEEPLTKLFNEELGAVIQVNADNMENVINLIEDAELECAVIGEPVEGNILEFSHEDVVIFSAEREHLLAKWLAFSQHIEQQSGNIALIKQAYQQATHPDFLGLTSHVTFEINKQFLTTGNTGDKPSVAILRHPDSQDTRAMAAAFASAGFEVADITMHALVKGKVDLSHYQGLAITGGASYNDVLSVGKGWANSILLQPELRQQFYTFFHDNTKFVLAVGNGAQLLTHLREIIPGTSLWPTFKHNTSNQLESRTCLVACLESKSIFCQEMAQTHAPIILSCKYGQAHFAIDATEVQLLQQGECVMQYVNSDGTATQSYPDNPTGAAAAVAGFCNEDGRITALMVHPERCFTTTQLSWHPSEWGTYSYTPWVKLFQNARLWLAQKLPSSHSF